MSVDSNLFRKGLGKFATGVTVVTTAHGERRHGMTVNSFTSVSLSPPLVLFCAELGTRTLELIRLSGVYAVNVLGDDQALISERFAGMLPEDSDRFAGLTTRPGPLTGCPLLEGVLATLECRVVNLVGAGDHEVVVAEVLDLALGEDRRPLLYYASNYFDFSDARALPRPSRERPDLKA